MAAKLNLLDMFPDLTLTTTTETAIQLPADVAADYAIVLFYRGHW